MSKAGPAPRAGQGHVRSNGGQSGHVSRSRTPQQQKVRRNRTKRRSPAPLPGPWRNSGGWTESFANNKPSPISIQDISPGFAQRKVVLLAEKRKFMDASQLLNQLQMGTLRAISTNLPIRLFIECIPESLIVLESIYSRLFIINADTFPVEELQVEALVFHIVRYMAMRNSLRDLSIPTPEDAMNSITNILRIVLYVNPELVRTLYSRKKLMDTALKGIGEHSMISMKGHLMNLHDALKDEFENTITQYKSALQKLETMNLSKSKPLTSRSFRNKRPSQSNHQELMKLTRDQIQERLYKNKTILNAVEASLYNRLPKLLQILQDRIEYDKNALLTFGQLQKEITSIPANTKVAPVIAQYTSSLKAVLDIFRNLLDEHGSETSSNLGYHTDDIDEDEQVLQLETADDDALDVQLPPPSPPDPDTSQQVTEAESDDNMSQVSGSSQSGAVHNTPAHLMAIDMIDQVISDTTSLNGHVSLHDQHVHKAPSQRKIQQQKEQTRRSRSEDRKGFRRGRSKERTRSRSVDRSSISRPRRDSVDESSQFQQMMKRINKVSASSPAVGRRQLVARGVSPSHSRDSSVSPRLRRRLISDAAHSIMSQKRFDELLQQKFPDYENKKLNSDSDSSASLRKKRLRSRRSRTESRSRSRSRNRLKKSLANRAAFKSAALSKAYSEMNINGIKYRPLSRLIGDVVENHKNKDSYSSSGESNITTPKGSQNGGTTPKEQNPKGSLNEEQKDAILREERNMRHTLEKERHRLLMRERELMTQVEQLKRELCRAKKDNERFQLRQREQKLVRRASINSNSSDTPIFIQDVPPSLPAPKPVRYSIGDLLYEYDKLYSEERADAWTALPNVTDVDDVEEIDDKKDRLLFSAVELAFGTAQTYLQQIMTGDRAVKAEGASGLDDEELLQFLQMLGDNFDNIDMVQDVQTLIVHMGGPHMQMSTTLSYYINHCVKLAWKFTIQKPPYLIDTSLRSFVATKHQRAPGSDRKNVLIKKYIWPCLVGGESQQCVYKGVVVT